METFTTEDLIAELQEHQQPIKERTEGGITQQEWGKAQGIGPRAAGSQLNKMLEEGVLFRVRQRCKDGLIRWVYYKTDNTK